MNHHLNNLFQDDSSEHHNIREKTLFIIWKNIPRNWSVFSMLTIIEFANKLMTHSLSQMFPYSELQSRIHQNRLIPVHIPAPKWDISAILVVNLANLNEINRLAFGQTVPWPIFRSNNAPPPHRKQTLSKSNCWNVFVNWDEKFWTLMIRLTKNWKVFSGCDEHVCA